MSFFKDIHAEPLNVWTPPRLVLGFVIILTIGTAMFFYHWLGPITEGHREAPIRPFISEMTGAFSMGLLLFPLAWIVEKRPLNASLQRIATYVGVVLVFAPLHTTMMWGSREAIHRLVGLGDYDYGRMPLRYFMELPFQLIALSMIITIFHAMRHLRITREHEVRMSGLETSLARAQLQNLRLQLQPHFLFNTLNTISASMYDDPAAADEMLDKLSELLRISLRTAQTDEVPLSAELATLDCYLEIMKARFGDRLDVRIEVDDGLSDTLVPSMILQPLVENAVRHGNAEREGRGEIVVRGRRETAGLRIVIENDGSDDGTGEISHGVGLATTAERLRLLYGEAQEFSAGSVADGFRVSLLIPEREGRDAP